MLDRHLREGIVKAQAAQNAHASAAELKPAVLQKLLVQRGICPCQTVKLLGSEGLGALVQPPLHIGKLGLGAKQRGEGVDHMLDGGLLARSVLAVQERALLGEDPHGLALGQIHASLGGLVFSRDQLEQGGFARSVDPDDAQLVPLVDRKGHALQHGGRSEAQGQVGG